MLNVGSITKQLRDAGHKLTPKRRAIVEILLAEGRHLSAKKIHQAMQSKFPRVSFDTVYRNLHLLEEMKLICVLEMQDCGCRYKINLREDHHHHWVCLGCGQTLEVPECPLPVLKKAAGEEKFKIVSHRFEVYGYCEGCQ
ncbi:MAG: Fur family transcriptional regulator [Thermincolia bacterium]